MRSPRCDERMTGCAGEKLLSHCVFRAWTFSLFPLFNGAFWLKYSLFICLFIVLEGEISVVFRHSVQPSGLAWLLGRRLWLGECPLPLLFHLSLKLFCKEISSALLTISYIWTFAKILYYDCFVSVQKWTRTVSDTVQSRSLLFQAALYFVC